jgi:DNA-binding NtrC family response regulator
MLRVEASTHGYAYGVAPVDYSAHSKTVLIIGGSVRLRDQLCLALSQEGCLIRVSGNDEAGLALIEQDAPDAVVLDPATCELGVRAFHQRLLDKNPLARLILIVSASDNCKRAAWSDVRYFLKTPINPSALYEVLSLRRRSDLL